MKKIILPSAFIIALILSYIAFIWTIDYSKVESDVKILSKYKTADAQFENMEIRKFPIPKCIFRGFILPGGVKADRIEVELDSKSILNRKPEINKINVIFLGNSMEIPINYAEDKVPHLGTVTVRVPNISVILMAYPDLWKIASSMQNNKDAIVSFDISDDDSSTYLKNFRISSPNFVGSGEVVIPNNEDSCSIKMQFEKFVLYGDELQKLDFAVTTKGNREIVIESFSGDIASGGSFKISGDLTRDDNRSLFLGHIDIAHNDVNLLMKKLSITNAEAASAEAATLSADIKMTQIEILLKNLSASFGDIKLSGNAGLQMIGKQPRINCDMNIIGFDSSRRAPILSDVIDYFASLAADMKDQNYDKKFIPLRNIQYLISFKLNMQSPLISTWKPDYIKMSGNVMPGKFSIDSLEYKYGNDNITASIDLSTTIVMPKLTCTISSGAVDITNLKVQDFLDFTDYASKKYDLSKVSIVLQAYLSNVTNSESKYTDFVISAYNADNNISISKVGYKIGDSEFAYNGSVLVAFPTAFNIGYTCNSVDISNLTGMLVSGFGDLSGFISSTGTIASNGSSLEELLYNFTIKANYIAEKLTLNGYDIDGIISKVNNPKYIWNENQLNMINSMNGGQPQSSAGNKTQDASILDKDFEIATSYGTTNLSKVKGSLSMYKGIVTVDNMDFVTAKGGGNLHGSYDIYKHDLHIQSDIKFPLYISGSSNIDSKFSIILENNDNLFEKFIDTENLQSDLAKRPITQFFNQ